MATSGSVNLATSRDELIKAAYQHIGYIGEGDTPSSTQYSEAALILNWIAKLRMTDGMPLWSLKTGYVLPVTGVSSVVLGGSDHAVSSYTATTSSAAASSGASTITVTSTTGFSNGYAIGIELSDSTMQWTTINGAPSGTTITLTATLTGAMSSGAQVYAYSTSNRIVRPLRVVDAYLYSVVDDSRHPLNVVTYSSYNSLGAPTSTGVPNQVYYDPSLSSASLFIYPRFLTGDNLIQIRYHRPFDDFDASSDEPDFPQEWFLPLMMELAALLGPKAGLSIEERRTLFQEAAAYREMALSNGTEEGSFRIMPERG